MVDVLAEKNIYTIDELSLKINGGKELCVAGFEVYLRQNSIPVIRLDVDPSHEPDDPVNVASNPTISELVEISDELQQQLEVLFSYLYLFNVSDLSRTSTYVHCYKWKFETTITASERCRKYQSQTRIYLSHDQSDHHFNRVRHYSFT